jgi:hypothetical protein
MHHLEKIAMKQRLTAALTKELVKEANWLNKSWDYAKKNPWKAAGTAALTAASFVPVSAPFAWGGRALMGGVQGYRAARAFKGAHTAHKAFKAARAAKASNTTLNTLKATRGANITKARALKDQSGKLLNKFDHKKVNWKNPLSIAKGGATRTADFMTAPISKGFTQNKMVRGATGAGMTGLLAKGYYDELKTMASPKKPGATPVKPPQAAQAPATPAVSAPRSKPSIPLPAKYNRGTSGPALPSKYNSPSTKPKLPPGY